MTYNENKLLPQRPCFLLDENFFKESKRGPPKEHSCQIKMKFIEPFWSRRIFKVPPYVMYSENKPRPQQPHFCRIKISSKDVHRFGEEDF